MTDTRVTLILLAVVIFLAAGAYLFYDYTRQDIVYDPPDTVIPEIPLPEAEWQTVTTTEYSFRYPADISESYVSLVDWPPQVQMMDEAFSCVEGGEEVARAGRTEPISVSGREYCRTVISEGAAGSVYRQYAYAFAAGTSTAIMTFSTRQPQCANYDEPSRADCEREQSGFDPDDLTDSIATTFSIAR